MQPTAFEDTEQQKIGTEKNWGTQEKSAHRHGPGMAKDDPLGKQFPSDSTGSRTLSWCDFYKFFLPLTSEPNNLL